MHKRRLDDRIRSLCSQLTKASNGDMEAILQELMSAIHEKIERLRGLAAGQFIGGKTPNERRSLPS
jgi:DNA-directed RNA polymerase specialized sigma24 family protein